MLKNIIYLGTAAVMLSVSQAQFIGKCTAWIREFDLCANDGDWTIQQYPELNTQLRALQAVAEKEPEALHQAECVFKNPDSKWTCCYQTWETYVFNAAAKTELLSSLNDVLNVTEAIQPGSYIPSWVERWNNHTQVWCSYDRTDYSDKWSCQGHRTLNKMFKIVVYLSNIALLALTQAQDVSKCTSYLNPFDLCASNSDWIGNKMPELNSRLKALRDYASLEVDKD
ncbi:hypothetical protein BG011_001988 [Mortierella polycephala]|uniref:Uncharacterized protein n=1 Tax=Mortierella polycephala TaxID=41804 RepID=A0A9P6U4J3_9FUNG|nr:hypothetical protein BG011_001988 [Mortierella polycephala]